MNAAPRSTARPAVHLVLLLIVAALLLVARQPDKVLYPQFWAEDAAIFYPEAEFVGAASFTRPYNGYWLLYPRLVAWIGTVTPIFYIPLLYVAGAGIAALAAFAAAAAGGMSRRRGTQVALVLGAALTPFSREVWLILTNVQWVFGLLLVAVLASPPPLTPAGRVLTLCASVAAAATGPLSLLLWPLALLRSLWYRDRWSVVLLVILLTCAAATWLTLSTHPRSGEMLGLETRLRALLQIARTKPAVTAAAATALALLLWTVRLGARSRHWPLIACASAGMLLMAGTVLAVPPAHLAALPHFGGRYAFVPWVCVVWTSILLLERGYRVAWGVLAIAAVVSAAQFSIAPLERHDWPRDARCLETHARCDIVVNPSWPVGLPGRGPGSP